MPRMILISPADLPRADHSRHWYSRGDSTTPPIMRSIVQKRFACSCKNVAINRRLWACSTSARSKPVRRSSLAKLSAAIAPLSSWIECKPAANPKFFGFFEQSAFGLRPISRLKSKPHRKGLGWRIARRTPDRRIRSHAADRWRSTRGYVEITLGALPGSWEELDMRSTTA